jgi:hypothetical protein
MSLIAIGFAYSIPDPREVTVKWSEAEGGEAAAAAGGAPRPKGGGIEEGLLPSGEPAAAGSRGVGLGVTLCDAMLFRSKRSRRHSRFAV